jgi:hypothetical protein
VPLLEQVIKRAADKDIWTAVISLVSVRAIPPSISNKAALDTPLKSTSSSQQGNEQTHDEIDPRILQEINGCIYKDTKGFYGEGVGQWPERSKIPDRNYGVSWLSRYSRAEFIHIDTTLSHSSTSFCGSLSATARKRIRICRTRADYDVGMQEATKT